MILRKVIQSDCKEITSIYNHYILNSAITFEEIAIAEDEMASRIEKTASKYPFLVVENENRIMGYAYATEWKARTAYRFSAEVTIYLHQNTLRKGNGSILFEALINECKQNNLHVLVGGIALPNEASIALHEKFGFTKTAHFKEIGYKFGKWIDVGYWELKL